MLRRHVQSRRSIRNGSRWFSGGALNFVLLISLLSVFGCAPQCSTWILAFKHGGTASPPTTASGAMRLSALSRPMMQSRETKGHSWPTACLPFACAALVCSACATGTACIRSARRAMMGRNVRLPTGLHALDGEAGLFPELCVFDLDACLWDKEMFEMREIPSARDKILGSLNGKGEGVVSVMSGRDRISLHPGSLMALQDHAAGRFPGMKIAVASSADTPFAEQVGRAALNLLEVMPGLTVWDLLTRDWDGRDVNQIGRQPPLSANKAETHFPRLREATGVRFDRMLFFDDCLWGDHCGKVSAGCREADTGKGVVAVRTPRGLGEKEWCQGLELYAAEATAAASA